MGMQHRFGDFGDFSVSVVVTPPPWYENCYIIQHKPTGDLVVVDPGGDADSIEEVVADLGGTPKAIWLTHGHPDHLGAARVLEKKLGIGTLAHAAESETIARSGDLNRSFTGEGQEGPAQVRLFEDEPMLELGGLPVRIIHTPGHTPGGVCYDFGGFSLTGDTLFRQGLGRSDLAGGNEAKLWASITRFLDLMPPETVLFSGHGPEWTAGEAKRWWKTMA